MVLMTEKDLIFLIMYFCIGSMAVMVFIIGFLFRGFFIPYLRVRASRGGMIIVKIKSTLRDYFKVGWFEDGFLLFKIKKDIIRINVADRTSIYKSLGVAWIDYDEDKSAILNADFKGVSGFDPVKYENLNTRALTRPTITNNTDKVIIILICIAILAGIGATYMGFTSYQESHKVLLQLPDLIRNLNATITMRP